jgi:hypothetical protein
MQIRSLLSPFAIRLLVAGLLASLPTTALAVDARLSWSVVPAAAGYKIYARASGGTYGTGMDVGPQQTATDGAVHFTLANLAVGTLLAVTTYDAAGIESARSNELAVPPPPATATPLPVATTAPTMTPPPVATTAPTMTPPPVATPTTTTATPLPTRIAPSATRALVASPTGTRTPIPSASATQPVKATIAPTVVATAGPTVPSVPTAAATASLIPPLVATATSIPTAVATPLPVTDLTMSGTIIARVTAPTGGGNHNLEVIRDGDRPPAGNWDSSRQYDTYDGPSTAKEDWIGYAYIAPQRFRRVLFQEGRHFWNGGWFETLTVQVRQNGQWVNVSGLTVTPPYPGLNAISYETFVMSFTAISGDAIRIYGRPGGSDDFISVGELRVYGDGTGVPPVPASTLADVTADGTIVARVPFPTGGGNYNLEVIRDGDMPPPGNTDSSRQYDSYDGTNTAPDDWIGYTYTASNVFRQVLFQEGRHFWNGGWFDSLIVQARQNGVWSSVSGLTFTPIYPGVNAVSYESFTLSFAPVTADGIRIYGRPGGSDDFISVGELRVYADPAAAVVTTQVVDTAPALPAPAPTTDAGAVVSDVTPTPNGAAVGGDGAATAPPAPIVATPVPAPSTSAPVDDVPSATCGNGRRETGEDCDGGDDAQCPGHCRTECACPIVVELPLTGWSPLDDASTSRLVEDEDTGTVALAVTDAGAATDVAESTATPAVAYPETPTLGLALSQLAFSARATASFDLEVAVTSVDDTRYTLVYRAADPDAAAPGAPVVAAADARAVFAIGAVMAAGEVGTTYRDLSTDLDTAFGAALASVDQVRVRGHVELFRIAIASDRGPGEDTAAELELPVAGWDESGRGTVEERAEDTALPGLTLRADSSERPVSLLHLTYPGGDTLRLLPFGTLAFAIRDADSFAVHVKGVAASGDPVDLDYAVEHTTPKLRLVRGELPLSVVSRATSPYGDVRIDVAADVAAIDANESLASITSVTFIGSFTVGDVRLRDPIAGHTTP